MHFCTVKKQRSNGSFDNSFPDFQLPLFIGYVVVHRGTGLQKVFVQFSMSFPQLIVLKSAW